MTPTPDEVDALVAQVKEDFPSWERTWTDARFRWPRPGKRVTVTSAQVAKLRREV